MVTAAAFVRPYQPCTQGRNRNTSWHIMVDSSDCSVLSDEWTILQPWFPQRDTCTDPLPGLCGSYTGPVHRLRSQPRPTGAFKPRTTMAWLVGLGRSPVRDRAARTPSTAGRVRSG